MIREAIAAVVAGRSLVMEEAATFVYMAAMPIHNEDRAK
jgi:hypothetical protein